MQLSERSCALGSSDVSLYDVASLASYAASAPRSTARSAPRRASTGTGETRPKPAHHGLLGGFPAIDAVEPKPRRKLLRNGAHARYTKSMFLIPPPGPEVRERGGDVGMTQEGEAT
jgi:hypothetical protein